MKTIKFIFGFYLIYAFFITSFFIIGVYDNSKLTNLDVAIISLFSSIASCGILSLTKFKL